jgi:putative flippase GtrA
MRSDEWPRHVRQVGLFLLVGLAQIALDTTVFVSLSALGLPVTPSNFLGRVSGASLGFWLNGRYTFADQGRARLSGVHLRRFAIAWLLLTALSTLTLQVIVSQHDLHDAWLAKPFVEALIAAIGFVVWRQWVFR